MVAAGEVTRHAGVASLPQQPRVTLSPSEPPSQAESGRPSVAQLLEQTAEGNDEAFDELIGVVYEELRGIASRRLRRERPDHTLDTTALVHEAYLRLVDSRDSGWQDRTHFFAVAARVIRHVLVDHARRASAAKRGGGQAGVLLSDRTGSTEARSIELIALDQALTRLAERDPTLERVVECRFFAGMTMPETAEALGRSLRSVERDWQRARAYLYRELAVDAEEGDTA